jgi:HK97 family phage major capsid protein
MNREQYVAKRQELMKAAQEFLAEGDIEKFKANKTDVENLDKEWEDIAQMQAEFAAMEKGSKVTEISTKSVAAAGKVMDSTNNVLADNVYDSIDYRKAFMNYVTHGTEIPGEFMNVDANTKTTDVGAVIPSTVLEKIIEKLESVGMILPLVTRTAIKGGVTVPTSSVKPVATWVAEGAGSDKQKKTTGTITFAYHKLRCAVSVSLETDTIALSVFETTLINNVTEAMVKALEQSIITGTGTGQPKGILAETPASGQALEVTTLTYSTLTEAEAALPLAYESDAVWCMNKKSFMAFIGIKDSAGQPICRVNYGINGRPERTLMGRTVVLTDYMPSFAAPAVATNTFAFLFNFNDYGLNTNYNMTIKKYEDNDTEDMVTKAIMLVDGKVLDKNSLVTLTVPVAG